MLQVEELRQARRKRNVGSRNSEKKEQPVASRRVKANKAQRNVSKGG
ncbi:hypothetical protein [Bacillus cereus]